MALLMYCSVWSIPVENSRFRFRDESKTLRHISISEASAGKSLMARAFTWVTNYYEKVRRAVLYPFGYGPLPSIHVVFGRTPC